jgi:hypothetical protein
MKPIDHRKLFSLLAACMLTLAGFAASSYGADLSAADRQFLGAYEKIHSALVADDLASAKKAAAALGAAGADIVKGKSLDEARGAFAALSATAEKLAAGQPGYYVLHCPMVDKDWVQTSSEVANPYGGKEMVSCGEVKK